MDRQAWDARYSGKDLVWGAQPNRFLAAELEGTRARGRALDLACGEGRNAIWLGRQGWRVTAVDFSGKAIERAAKLAAEQGVEVEWIRADVMRFEAEPRAFQLVLILYLQVPEPERRRLLDRAAAALAPGGELLIIGHALRNLSEGYGGPSSADVLWEPARVRAELEARGLGVKRCEELLREVETEQGVASAIDLIARARRGASPSD